MESPLPAPKSDNHEQLLHPYVIDKTGRGERQYDIYSRLLEDRIVFIGTPINDDVANSVMAQLLFLDRAGGKQDVRIYINSPGGSGDRRPGDLRHDAADRARHPDLLPGPVRVDGRPTAGGVPPWRHALPNSRVMIHQPSGGSQGTAKDMEISVKEILKIKRNLEGILAHHCG
ncbi:MAG: ATP-dependent Clp protease proteolytic subunit [Planctomycetota bacterium]